MSNRRGVSKWQVKSSRVNQIRWELEELLSRDLSDEEKQSDKYDELIESIEVMYKHLLPVTRKKSRRNTWKLTLLISLATSGGAIALKLLEFLITLLSVAKNTGSSP